jgi:hypothetical protein
MNYRTQQAASILQRNAIRMAEFGYRETNRRATEEVLEKD